MLLYGKIKFVSESDKVQNCRTLVIKTGQTERCQNPQQIYILS